MEARVTKAINVLARFSQSLVRRRLRPNQEKVRPGCHRCPPTSHGKLLRMFSSTSVAPWRSWMPAEWRMTRIGRPSVSTKAWIVADAASGGHQMHGEMIALTRVVIVPGGVVGTARPGVSHGVAPRRAMGRQSQAASRSPTGRSSSHRSTLVTTSVSPPRT